MTELQFKNQIVKEMKEVGTYREEFIVVIKTLAKIMVDYQATLKKFEESGAEIVIEHTNKSRETNIVKNPMYAAIETMRAQILKYLNELGLTPAGLKKINDKALTSRKGSALARALSQLE